MSRAIIAETKEAGNASDAIVFTMPAGYSGFIGTLSANNTTGGTLTLSLFVTRQNGTKYNLITTDSLGTTVSAYYSGSSAKCITPLTLASGESLSATGSGAGIYVTASGQRFTD